MDPGWRPALRGAIPLLGSTGSRGRAPIVWLRSIWLTFCLAVLLIAWVVPFIGTDQGHGAISAGAAMMLVLTAGCVELLVLFWTRQRPLPEGERAAVAKQFTDRFFVQMAFAEVPALLGFVLAVASNRYVVVYLGVAISLLGFGIAAPTRRRLAREDPRVVAAVCGDG
jgi:hypothetical protein